MEINDKHRPEQGDHPTDPDVEQAVALARRLWGDLQIEQKIAAPEKLSAGVALEEKGWQPEAHTGKWHWRAAKVGRKVPGSERCGGRSDP
jgi:hypothetical protein